MKKNFKQTLAIFNKRKTGNTYVPKIQNIFLSWKKYVKEEQNAVNIIGAIARQTLRREIFQRIRMDAREKKIDRSAIRKCQKFFNNTRLANLRHALNRWRENMKSLVIQELVYTEEMMQETIHQNGEHLEKINETKHVRADQCLKREKVRKVNTAMV